ncbi:MAG: hypothetical protein HOP11_13330 [Saprospiraceae bacterium]|nr:hypothetical protein [Saprospiraceae bacterium]
MNEAHIHLIINHLPIIFPIAGIIAIITGLISKSESVKRTSFLIFILGALATIAAMKSGEGAEDVVEKISGVSEVYIEKHEELAERFAIFSYLLGGISLLGLWISFKKNANSNIFNVVILSIALSTLFLAQKTGTSGGEIRHTEIRNDSTVPPAENNSSGEDNDE